MDDREVEVLIGRRLRRRRRLFGLTQAQLGALCGVRFQQVQKYETATNRVSALMLWKLAEALDVSVSYFFEEPRAVAAANQSDAHRPLPPALQLLTRRAS